MTTIIINEKTKKGQIILELIREMGVGKIVEETVPTSRIPNKVTQKAMAEVEAGKVTFVENVDDLFDAI